MLPFAGGYAACSMFSSSEVQITLGFFGTALRQRHTALLGTVVQHLVGITELDCVRGEYMILPPVPVRYII